jgi:hypothetical protein
MHTVTTTVVNYARKMFVTLAKALWFISWKKEKWINDWIIKRFSKVVFEKSSHFSEFLKIKISKSKIELIKSVWEQ